MLFSVVSCLLDLLLFSCSSCFACLFVGLFLFVCLLACLLSCSFAKCVLLVCFAGPDGTSNTTNLNHARVLRMSLCDGVAVSLSFYIALCLRTLRAPLTVLRISDGNL